MTEKKQTRRLGKKETPKEARKQGTGATDQKRKRSKKENGADKEDGGGE